MNIGHTICLAAALVLSQSLHAQGCSRSAEGGIDATGNQCNAPGGSPAYTSENGAVPFSRMSGAGPADSVRIPSARPPKYSMTQFRPALARGRERPHLAAAAANEPPKIVKVEGQSEARCSGGVDGGMDTNGNQCGD
jgi:hypothetical protein